MIPTRQGGHGLGALAWVAGLLLCTCTSAPAPVPGSPARGVAEPPPAAAAAAAMAAPEMTAPALPRFGAYYVAEGDLLLTEDEVRRLQAQREASTAQARPPGAELVVNTASGVPTVWPPGKRRLTYSVDRASFGSDDRYRIVVANLERAGRDWAEACPECGVEFVHVPTGDGAAPVKGILFNVRMADSGGAFIAAAFFPDWAPMRRVLQVDPSYFRTSFDPVGVLRHELGHVLGYRHEQVRGVPGCRPEGTEWLPITPYDPHSVMHYLCGGGGSFSLELTAVDRQGHRRQYAPAGSK